MSRAMKRHHSERLKGRQRHKDDMGPCGCWFCIGRPRDRVQERRAGINHHEGLGEQQ